MTFWSVFVCCLLIPAIQLLAGEWMVRRPPRKINGLVGYRTRRSMASREAWIFAQEYCGRLWRKLGAWALGISAGICLIFSRCGERALTWGMLALEALQLAAVIGSIFPVERALKRNFDERGNRIDT